MRSKFATAAVMLVAVFAISAVAASAAFGYSEFNAAGGANPKGITFKGTGGKAFIESQGGNKIECEKSASEGKFEGKTEARVTKLEFSGKCKLSGTIKAECPTITLKQLKVLPGTEVGNEEVRLEEFLPVNSEDVLAEYTCGSTKYKYIGGVICLDTKPALGLKSEVECKQIAGKPGDQEFKEAEVDGKTVKARLEIEATAGIFKLKEEDSLNMTGLLTSSAEVEQTA